MLMRQYTNSFSTIICCYLVHQAIKKITSVIYWFVLFGDIGKSDFNTFAIYIEGKFKPVKSLS